VSPFGESRLERGALQSADVQRRAFSRHDIFHGSNDLVAIQNGDLDPTAKRRVLCLSARCLPRVLGACYSWVCAGNSLLVNALRCVNWMP
jgi:hypothetical protein